MGDIWQGFLSAPWYTQVLACCLLAVWLADTLLIAAVYLRAALLRSQPQPMHGELPLVTVVICLRDGLEDVEAHLPLWLSQRYPRYELLLVDNTGNDETAMALERLRRSEERVKVCTVNPDERFSPNRKFALAVGLKAAEGEWIVITESSFRPAGDLWLTTLGKHFTPEVDVVLGYGRLARGHGRVGLWARAHARWTALGRMGFALCGAFSLGQRRNLAFRRELFFAHDGYKGYNHLAGGEDDLFTLAVSGRGRTRVELAPDGQTEGPCPADWAEWARRSRIDRSTWAAYPLRVRFWLRLEGGLRYMLWGMGIAISLMGGWWLYLGLGAIGLRLLLQSITVLVSWHRQGMRGSLIGAWIYDLISPLAKRGGGRGVNRIKRHGTWK